MILYDENLLPEDAKYDDSIKVIDFHAFVENLDLFQPKNTHKQEEQLKLLYRTLDISEDGYLSEDDLY